MRIGIDVSQVVYGTGVSNYTKELVKNLLKVDKENEYVLFGGSLRRRKEIIEFANKLDGNFNLKISYLSPTLADLFFNKLHFPKVELFSGKIDIFHSSDWSQPKTNAKKITTVHDLAPLRFPKLTDPKIVAVTKRRFKWIKRDIDRIIVPSEATKDDLSLLKIDKKKIVVIPEAPIKIITKISANKIKRIKKQHKVHEDYVLAVGVGPRKNTDRIIQAFHLARPDMNLNLVIVGENRYYQQDEKGVRFLGHVSEEDLAHLYSGAKALVYTSLYEGFGLPILSSFSYGCPVVTSNISSMPEVAGDAAVMVDPYDVNSIAEGILKAIKENKDLVKKGKIRLSEFSWKKTAEQTLEVYKDLGKN